MPYICNKCGSEGRYDSEQDVPYDAYTYYANCDTVDTCPDCNKSLTPDKDDHRED